MPSIFYVPSVVVADRLCWVSAALKGATTLKARSGCKNRLSGGVPILPIEDNNDLDFDFEKGRLILSQGAELYVETPEGTFVQQKALLCSTIILNF